LIRLSALVVFGQVWLAPRLPGFLARYPEVTLQLSLIERTVDQVEDGPDLAICIAREPSPGLAARERSSATTSPRPCVPAQDLAAPSA
jgi:DNA-binding transcriptional LysR family regulator